MFIFVQVLILTDTHGHLHLINKLAHKHSAQAGAPLYFF